MGFPQGDFIRIVKLFFLFERSHDQKRKYFFLQRTSFAKDFPYVKFFCRKKVSLADYRIFYLQRIRIFFMRTFHIDIRKCTLRIFIPLEIHDHIYVFLLHWKFTTTWGFFKTLSEAGVFSMSVFSVTRTKGNRKIDLSDWN